MKKLYANNPKKKPKLISDRKKNPTPRPTAFHRHSNTVLNIARADAISIEPPTQATNNPTSSKTINFIHYELWKLKVAMLENPIGMGLNVIIFGCLGGTLSALVFFTGCKALGFFYGDPDQNDFFLQCDNKSVLSAISGATALATAGLFGTSNAIWYDIDRKLAHHEEDCNSGALGRFGAPYATIEEIVKQSPDCPLSRYVYKPRQGNR